MSHFVVYDAPKGAVGMDDYKVSIRVPGEHWQDLFVYEVKVDMHDVRKASMVYFDMEGPIEVRLESRSQTIKEAVIRPLSLQLLFQQDEHAITFVLEKPCKIVVEMNRQRFSALHLFANPLESEAVDLEDENTVMLTPQTHSP